MPVRFQVDPDFYDHPKTIGMTDAATALWTRAGSYSAAKLTDGFIAEHVLALLSRTPEDAADELVRRGLWKRCRGGFRFHQWNERNLTKARVEADKKRDREAKRKARAEKASQRTKRAERNEKPQDSPEFVRPDSDETPPGLREDSGENPPLSVSVSSSVSESVSQSSSTRRNAHEDDEDRIDQKITDLLHELTGRTVPPDWAARVRRHLLDGRDVDRPIAYVTRSIRARPRDFLPPPTPPSAPVPAVPPLGERDNAKTNARGRALLEEELARSRARRAEAPTEPGSQA